MGRGVRRCSLDLLGEVGHGPPPARAPPTATRRISGLLDRLDVVVEELPGLVGERLHGLSPCEGPVSNAAGPPAEGRQPGPPCRPHGIIIDQQPTHVNDTSRLGPRSYRSVPAWSGSPWNDVAQSKSPCQRSPVNSTALAPNVSVPNRRARTDRPVPGHRPPGRRGSTSLRGGQAQRRGWTRRRTGRRGRVVPGMDPGEGCVGREQLLREGGGHNSGAASSGTPFAGSLIVQS